MIKHECQLHKTGKWSLQNVRCLTSADGGRGVERTQVAKAVQLVQAKRPQICKRMVNQFLPREVARRRPESSKTEDAEEH